MSSVQGNISELPSIEGNMTKDQTEKVKGSLGQSGVPKLTSTQGKKENGNRKERKRRQYLANPNWQPNNEQQIQGLPGSNAGTKSMPVKKEDENGIDLITTNTKQQQENTDESPILDWLEVEIQEYIQRKLNKIKNDLQHIKQQPREVGLPEHITGTKSIVISLDKEIEDVVQKLFKQGKLTFNPDDSLCFTTDGILFNLDHVVFVVLALLLTHDLPLSRRPKTNKHPIALEVKKNENTTKTAGSNTTADESHLSALRIDDKGPSVHEVEKKENENGAPSIWFIVHVMFGFVMGVLLIYFL